MGSVALCLRLCPQTRTGTRQSGTSPPSSGRATQRRRMGMRSRRRPRPQQHLRRPPRPAAPSSLRPRWGGSGNETSGAHRDRDRLRLCPHSMDWHSTKAPLLPALLPLERSSGLAHSECFQCLEPHSLGYHAYPSISLLAGPTPPAPPWRPWCARGPRLAHRTHARGVHACTHAGVRGGRMAVPRPPGPGAGPLHAPRHPGLVPVGLLHHSEGAGGIQGGDRGTQRASSATA